MSTRSLLGICLVLIGLVACRDPEASRPASELETAPPGEPPARPPASLPDPAEPDIPDLARLARYVFREMRDAEPVCSFVNPFHDPLSFAVHVEVRDGRMTGAHLAWAALGSGQEARPLQPPPPELTAYAECLAPRLEAVRMDPAPADGAYQPQYAYPRHPGTQ